MKVLKGGVLDVDGFSATIDEKSKTLTIAAQLKHGEHDNYKIFINDKEKLAYAGEKLIDWKEAFNSVTNEYATQMREINNQLVGNKIVGKAWEKSLREVIDHGSLELHIENDKTTEVVYSFFSDSERGEKATEINILKSKDNGYSFSYSDGRSNEKITQEVAMNSLYHNEVHLHSTFENKMKSVFGNEATEKWVRRNMPSTAETVKKSSLDDHKNIDNPDANPLYDREYSDEFIEAMDDWIDQGGQNKNIKPIDNPTVKPSPNETLLLKLYDKSEIPSKVLGHEFSEKQIALLSRGEMVTISGISLDGIEKRDIAVKMQSFLDDQQQVQKGLMFSVKAKTLEIPDRILDHQLSAEEKQSLHKGEFVGIVKDDRNFLVSVNQKTNSVVVNVPAELGIKEELGGYKFSKNELAHLANGKELPTRLFKSDKHGFYTAELRVVKEGNQVSYQFNNVASINPAEAAKLSSKLNNHLLPSEDNTNKVIDTVLSSSKSTTGQETTIGKGVAASKDNKALKGAENTPKKIR